MAGFLINADGTPAVFFVGATDHGGTLSIPPLEELEQVHLYSRRSGQVVAVPVRKAVDEGEGPLPDTPSGVSEEARTRPFSVEDFDAPAEVPRP